MRQVNLLHGSQDSQCFSLTGPMEDIANESSGVDALNGLRSRAQRSRHPQESCDLLSEFKRTCRHQPGLSTHVAVPPNLRSNCQIRPRSDDRWRDVSA